ncbi:MAG: hypothetical protein A2Y12_19300 [Planctomycetes bacterium GWF2_42_9]|nr:MAG: hypothetical protein A2Y12_19300 [Planctomycetes bacterium GWF2_42_9]
MKEKFNNKIGLVGFILSLFGILSSGLISIPALGLCIVGIIRKSYRKLSIAGVVLCILGFVLLSVWTPPGSVPYPLSVFKYSLNAPSFWLLYRPFDTKKACSQYWLFGGAGGSLYYVADKNKPFEKENVINFAEKHKWHFTEEIAVPKETILRLIDKNQNLVLPDIDFYFEDKNEDAAIQEFEFDKKVVNLTMKGFPFWIKEDCIILCFDTGNVIKAQSVIVIDKNKTTMAVYYNGSR